MVDWIGFLLPARCGYCAAPTGGLPVCEACVAGLPWNRNACPRCAQPQAHDAPCARCLARAPRFDSAWTAFRLEPPIQAAVHALKYRAQFLPARVLGELMARELARRAGPMPQALIPVPLHTARLRRRGYNQALEIARVLARRCAIELDPSSLRRVRATPDQIGQSAAQRRRNLRGAFRAQRRLDGLHVALLDDVMTTGATLEELARVCRAAGAARIEAWAAARTP